MVNLQKWNNRDLERERKGENNNCLSTDRTDFMNNSKSLNYCKKTHSSSDNQAINLESRLNVSKCNDQWLKNDFDELVVEKT